MAFDQRPPTSGGIDPDADPNLPIADSSQGHDIPTGAAPSLAKLQDWVAWLRINAVNVIYPGLQTIAGSLRVENFLSLTQSIGVSADPGANNFHNGHLPKAWAHFRTFTSGAGSYVVDDGINIGLLNVTATYIDVDLVRALASTFYAPQVTNLTNTDHRPHVDYVNSTVSKVRVVVRDAAGAIVDPSSTGCRIALLVMGRHA